LFILRVVIEIAKSIFQASAPLCFLYYSGSMNGITTKFDFFG
jgi:hypothetical protein